MLLKVIKVLIVCLASASVLLIVSHVPLVYLGGRGIVGKGLFIYINEYTAYGLTIYTLLFCSAISLILRLPKLVLAFLSCSLAFINFSILVLDARASQYSDPIEKIIFNNYGTPESINTFGYCLLGIGGTLFLIASYIFYTYKGRAKVLKNRLRP